MVRLKGCGHADAVCGLLEFQFHSGSIKRQIPIRSQSRGPLFQFHSGSIKRGLEKEMDMTLYRFQFHSGSIKRPGRGAGIVRDHSVSIP